MDATLKKIVKLIESPDLELRTAAIQVAAEIGLARRPVIRALSRCLRESREDLQILALKALGRLGASDVAQVVVPLILTEGILRDHAIAVVTAIGPKAAPLLERIYDEAQPQGKRAVVTALAGIGGRQALRFIISRIPEEPFELQNHLISSVCDALDCTPAPQQGPLFSLVVELLQSRAARQRETLIGALNILGHFRGQNLAAKSRKLLMKYAERRQAPEVRRYALVALKLLTNEARLNADYLKFFKKMLCDPDWQNVAQHALAGFQQVGLSELSLDYLVDILRSTSHYSVQSHIFRRLEDQDRPEIARRLIPFLSDARFAVREKAETALRRLPSAISSLFQVLLTDEDLEVVQRVNSILRDFPMQLRRRYLERAASALMRFFEKNDERYLAFLDFVRSVDPEPLRKRVYQKARTLKAGRSRTKWEKISAHLRLLWDNHLITAEGRYLLAVSLIRRGSKDLSPDARRGSLGLQVIRALIYDDQERLARTLKLDPDLKPDDYFYLGFHFSEEGEHTRAFGLSLLRHVTKRFPRSEVSGPAKHKLQAQLRALEEDTREAARKQKRKDKVAGAKAARGSSPATSGTAQEAQQEARPQAEGARRLTIRNGASAAAARASRRKPVAAARHKTPVRGKATTAASRAKRKVQGRSGATKPRARKSGARSAASGKKKPAARKRARSAASGKKKPAARKGAARKSGRASPSKSGRGKATKGRSTAKKTRSGRSRKRSSGRAR